MKPGDVVVDVGAGSAILSMFAVQAGAVRVYGIERAPGAAALARRVVNDNGLADRVRIVEGSAESVRLPEPADVVVSEWLGVFGVDENMLPPVLVARDRWLKPGGEMIPGEVTAWIAPAWHPAGSEATSFLAMEYGLNLAALAPFNPDQVCGCQPRSRGPIWSGPQRLWVSDPAACRARRLLVRSPPSSCSTSTDLSTVSSPGSPLSFQDAPLTNGPGAAATHWGQFLFPIANGRAATSNDRLDVGFHCVPSRAGGSDQLWACQVNGGPLEVHDSRRVPRQPGLPPWRVYYHGPGVASPSPGAA